MIKIGIAFFGEGCFIGGKIGNRFLILSNRIIAKTSLEFRNGNLIIFLNGGGEIGYSLVIFSKLNIAVSALEIYRLGFGNFKGFVIFFNCLFKLFESYAFFEAVKNNKFKEANAIK